jgi:erythromycin esterase
MKTRLLSMLLAMSAPTVLAANPPALVNLSFQQSDAADGKPAGWTLLGGNYDVRTECETTCALHLQSRDGAGQADGVYQQVAPGSATGHLLILSGRIRTEHVEGNAFLAVRILGDTGTIGDHANGPVPPNGTTGWQHFDLVVPVPANATGLAIGAVLRGKGSAWIDSLELKVDESVTVAAFVPKPPPVAPSRPVPSQQLLDDAALRIADDDVPPIPPAVRSDVLARRHPVRSLFSDDFSDLQFLKPLLEGKRLVQLGEASHGVAESNWAKVRLIKFLHQEMGFDVVAFEGSFNQCFEADKDIGTLAPQYVMGQCLFSIWHTKEVIGLFEFMATVRKSATPLTLAGFDIQFSGYRSDKTRMRGMLAIADASLATHLDEYEQEIGAGKLLTAQRSASVQAYYGDVAKALGARRAKLRTAGYAPTDIDMEIQTAHTRTWLARQSEHLDVPNSKDGNTVRDAGMAEQLNFVLDSLYPHHKLIVWAHNMHVTNAHAAGDFTSMGELLAQRRRAEIYTVGFYMGRGMVNNWSGAPNPVPAAPSNTVEGVLANGGLKYAFVDFSKAVPGPSTRWFTEKNTVREWGTVPKEIIPARSYDAIFYIDTVTPAEKY